MVTQAITINNLSGLHLRPAGEFSKAAKQCQSKVYIIFEGNRINGKSPVSVVGAGIKKGAEIVLECVGENEERDLQSLLKAIESGLGE